MKQLDFPDQPKSVSASDIIFDAPLVARHDSNNPLLKYSLIGSLAELQKQAQEQIPLLGNLCLRGQATVWYAKPNVGKTLITLHLLRETLERGTIDGGQVFYVAADDTAAGVLEKLQILQPFGIHVLAPGFNNLQAKDLPRVLRAMIADDTVGDSFLILDTLKKFVPLMSKQESSAFADVARQFVMKGGTILGLAHTNKRLGADGKPIVAGTSDILDDFDGGYTIIELPQQANRGERVVQFDCIKSRGQLIQQVAYGYSVENGVTYAELLDSVRLIDPDAVSQIRQEADQAADLEVTAAIESCIAEGISGKMDIARAVMSRCKIGRQAACRIIEKYTGDDPAVHRWTFSVGDRGKQGFILLANAIAPGCAPGEEF